MSDDQSATAALSVGRIGCGVDEVFVVIAVSCEPESAPDWIVGAYETKDEADRAAGIAREEALRAQAAARDYEHAHQRLARELYLRQCESGVRPRHVTDEMEAEILNRLGPEPSPYYACKHHVVRVPLGVAGRYEWP